MKPPNNQKISYDITKKRVTGTGHGVILMSARVLSHNWVVVNNNITGQKANVTVESIDAGIYLANMIYRYDLYDDYE